MSKMRDNVVLLLLCGATLAVHACVAPVRIGIEDRSSEDGDASFQNGFTPPRSDADDADAAPPASEPVAMCPVTTCSFPHATCASSEFPCDVDLLTDDENCGGCGKSCTRGINIPFAGRFSCVHGECVFGCTNINYADCDNDVANGCETKITGDALNCGACGNECPIPRDGSPPKCENGQCADPCANFPDQCGPYCVDLRSNGKHCGACGNVCDHSSLPPPPAHAEYGCQFSHCGQPKCVDNSWGDCNVDLDSDHSDGCETSLTTTTNCGACGISCAAGQTCGKRTSASKFVQCLCPDPSTYCPQGHPLLDPCKRLDTDPTNCGACSRACPGKERPHFVVTCTLGVCGGQCAEHFEDCDALYENGCETNTLVDNRNCGACGNACAPNQVCSEGKCLVAPCEQGPTK